MLGFTVRRIFHCDIGDKLKESINQFNLSHHGTVFHEVEFNEKAAKVCKTDLSYFVAYIESGIVGICPCHSIRKSCTIHSFSNLSSHEIPYGGWIFDERQVSIDTLMQETHLRANECLHIASNLATDSQVIYKSKLFKSSIGNTLVQRLDDTNSERLFEIMNSKQRNKIKRAIKLGVEVKALGPAEFDIFWDLFCILKGKINLPIREKSFYEQIFSYYFKQGRGICLGALYEDKVVSAMILLANTNYTIAWVAGRIETLPNNLYQNELLFWESIKWAERFGSSFFDFCGLDEVNLPHLARLKLSFSKDIKPIYYYSKKTFLFRILNRICRGA